MKSIHLLVLSSLMLVGCVRSVHPFYTDAQLVVDPALNGVWARAGESAEKEMLSISANVDARSYDLVYTDNDSKTARFVVHLAKVGDHLLADIYPEELKTSSSDIYGVYFLPLHSFMLVTYNAGSLKFRQMDPEWLNKQLEAQPNLLKHEKLDDQIILTAPTAQLQEFILKHVTTEGAFGETTEFKWTGPATQPG